DKARSAQSRPTIKIQDQHAGDLATRYDAIPLGSVEAAVLNWLPVRTGLISNQTKSGTPTSRR
ncbi:MAG: hypothetical protein ACKOBM_18180, partial [Gammaproteobacteria bacterium]